MIIKKITTGFVIQSFDTEKNKFVSQEFIAGDQVDYEDENGDQVGSAQREKMPYLPFDMLPLPPKQRKRR